MCIVDAQTCMTIQSHERSTDPSNWIIAVNSAENKIFIQMLRTETSTFMTQWNKKLWRTHLKTTGLTWHRMKLTMKHCKWNWMSLTALYSHHRWLKNTKISISPSSLYTVLWIITFHWLPCVAFLSLCLSVCVIVCVSHMSSEKSQFWMNRALLNQSTSLY